MQALPAAFSCHVVKARTERAAARLDGEIDDRRRATEGRCARAGLEGVLGEGAAERQLHMGVAVDAAGDDPLAGGVHDRVGRDVEVDADQGDLIAIDEDVRPGHGVGIDDGSALDEGAHPSSFRMRAPARSGADGGPGTARARVGSVDAACD